MDCVADRHEEGTKARLTKLSPARSLVQFCNSGRE
jgi:hypothetical protein